MGVTLDPGHRLLQPPGSVDGWHQLLYATRGILTVHTTAGTWVVPPHRGVWIPQGFRYRLEMSGTVALRSLYIRARRQSMPRECSVVNVTPLMRELIVRTNRIGALDSAIPQQRRLAGVILDELKLLASVPLQLPLPKDSRARKFAALLSDDPGVTLETAIRRSGASRRTLERLFRAEAGMSLGQWLRRRKLLDALRRVAAGECVDAIAAALGYNSASAFIAMFRRELGQTPKRYFES